MDTESAQEFVQALGSKQTKVRSNGWISGTCPLALFTHKKATDNNPSFAIEAVDGQRARYNCYSCQSGSAEDLLGALEMHWTAKVKAEAQVVEHAYPETKPNFKLAREILNNEGVKVKPLPGYTEFGMNTVKMFEEWSEYVIDSFPTVINFPEAVSYLESRDMNVKEIIDREIRWDADRRMVVMPYRNVYGKLAGARGRCIDAGVSGWKKHFDYSWNGRNNAALTWYNEQSLQLSGPVVVVEGQFDAIRVAKRWPKVVATLTAKPTYEKLRRLLQSPGVIHIPDNDGPGGTGDLTIELYSKFCALRFLKYRCIKLPLPAGETKIDPGACHADYLFDRIKEVADTI